MHLGCMTTLAIGSKLAEEAAGAARLPALARTSRPTMNEARIRMVVSSARAELLLQRQLPNALAGRGKNRVRHGSRGDRRARFANSAGRFPVAHQVYLDGRHLVDPKDANVVEVGLLHSALLERHFAPEGTADSEQDPT